MKLRAGFVTNSSTTSYLLICPKDFMKEDLADLMGIQRGSPLSGMVDSLYESLHSGLEPARSAWKINEKYDKDFEAYIRGEFSEKVLAKVLEAEKQGKTVYIGSLASDNTMTESFFCCDSFEWENDKLYLNALNCVW